MGFALCGVFFFLVLGLATLLLPLLFLPKDGVVLVCLAIRLAVGGGEGAESGLGRFGRCGRWLREAGAGRVGVGAGERCRLRLMCPGGDRGAGLRGWGGWMDVGFGGRGLVTFGDAASGYWLWRLRAGGVRGV